MRLAGARRSGPGFTAKCPAHEDCHQSLSVADGDSAVVVKCFAGCDFDSIVQAAGVDPKELFPMDEPQKRDRPLCEYEYTDEHGDRLFKVSRYEGKKFVQSRWEAGAWTFGLNGTRRVPYRLREVLEGIANDRTIFLVEGEKDVETLRANGFVATTSPGGANGWKGEYAGFFRGARVAVLPDNDPPGNLYAAAVVKSLTPVAKNVRIVRLPGLPAKGDVTDWFAAGKTVDEFKAEVKGQKKAEGLALVSAKGLREKVFADVKWVIPNLLPEGLCILSGDPKMGKSFLALQLCGGVGGKGTVLGSFRVEKGKAIYYALEDPLRRLAQRVEGMFRGQDLPGLYVHTELPVYSKENWLPLENWLDENPDCRLVVVDTFVQVKPQPSGKFSANVYELDSTIGKELRQFAQRHHVCVVLVHHNSKGASSGGDFLKAISGSMGLPGAADTVMVLQRGRGDQTATLKVTGRDVEDQSIHLYRDPSTGGWTTDNPLSPRAGDVAIQTLSLARKCNVITAFDVMEETGAKEDNAKKTLQRLAETGKLERVRPGVYRLPRPGGEDKPTLFTINGETVGTAATEILPLSPPLSPSDSGSIPPSHSPQTMYIKELSCPGQSRDTRGTDAGQIGDSIEIKCPPYLCKACGGTTYWTSLSGCKSCNTCYPPKDERFISSTSPLHAR